jgi:predicted Zn-dependent protease
MTSILAKLAMGFLLLFGSGCATLQHDPVSGGQVRNLYTMDDDIRLGKQTLEQILEQSRQEGIPINRDSVMLNTLSNMMQRIAAVSHYPHLPYSVTLIHTNIVNAACTPGGQMIFWEGLYDPKIGMVQNEQELAAVMAHEIAHATGRHTTRTMTRALPGTILLTVGAIAAEVTDNRDLALAVGGAFLVYQGLLLPKYSREHEFEADRLGIFYMADAGYDPRAAVAIWQRMHAQSNNPNWLAFLSSHPSHADRHRALERLLPEALQRYEAARSRP